eukprot:2817572-Amphidinium_carterae.1
MGLLKAGCWKSSQARTLHTMPSSRKSILLRAAYSDELASHVIPDDPARVSFPATQGEAPPLESLLDAADHELVMGPSGKLLRSRDE